MGRVGDLRVGSYAIVDDEPCQIVDIQKSKTGKHGSAKFRCSAISIFDGSKRSFVSPVDATAPSTPRSRYRSSRRGAPRSSQWAL